MEVTSHEGGIQDNQSDQNRMILQGSCLARLGNVLTSEPNSDPVVIVAIFIDKDLIAHEYLMYQPPSEVKKVLYHEETFKLTESMEAFNFVFWLYNLLSGVIEVNARLDQYSLSRLGELADYIYYNDDSSDIIED
ncbi:hypothetical protein B0F90DRAFT_442426 [Multifurca ochricompacta]|uniref:Uncharacterized protein n=1 Tax=Multifurca ochricompacta TaxID=376703 RepID=A0AAD4QJ48_9AGAM|nr:hypothetical protein B0F90DRAFT_442426 [Multifurca ochricompacta]